MLSQATLREKDMFLLWKRQNLKNNPKQINNATLENPVKVETIPGKNIFFSIEQCLL